MKHYVSAKEHYNNLLGSIYSWMTGNFEENTNKFKKFLTENDVKPHGNKIAIDLGAGHGIQSIPLAELGFNVVAIDFNQNLLDELKINSRGLPITIIDGDIRRITDNGTVPELILCCGDTLSHLESKQELETFILDLSRTLAGNGKLILSFRDYATLLTGPARVIPVASNDKRILTCILDYEKDFVNVTDLLHESVNSQWTTSVSTYRKIRLNTLDILDLLRLGELTVTFNNVTGGLTTIIATKPG